VPLADTRRSGLRQGTRSSAIRGYNTEGQLAAGGVGANDWARNEARSPDIVVALYAQTSEIARALLVRHDTMATPTARRYKLISRS
jgi:hypothetical protein